ncbi:MAG TPA: ABC transporter ATP-binding protein [Stellaceae bacterium]|nr:ABC transporter ATP-binding protein [Stellaceae bacterium]
MVETPLLSVRGLTVAFETRRGAFDAVRAVSFDVQPGRVLGVVGESGSGKSVTAMALMRLLPNAARVEAGEVRFAGRDLASLTERQMQAVRGREIAMVFQDPMSSLNPILTVGHQLREPLVLQLGLSRTAAQARAEELLALVRIPSPGQIMRAYPHELSGGMRQRVMIAIALSCGPKLLIADEPTTALDVTTQAQVLDLLRDLQQRLHMAVLLITHDLGVIAAFADDVQVMYAGRIVERSPVAALFDRPGHPYTEGLLRSMPPLEDEDPDILPAIEGNVASPFAMPTGCAFHPRCPYAWDDCARILPPPAPLGAGHDAACLRHTTLAA